MPVLGRPVCGRPVCGRPVCGTVEIKPVGTGIDGCPAALLSTLAFLLGDTSAMAASSLWKSSIDRLRPGGEVVTFGGLGGTVNGFDVTAAFLRGDSPATLGPSIPYS